MRLTQDELTATRTKIDKINARAQKRGWTGRLDVDAERVEVTTKDDLGFEITEILYDTSITGDAPSYDGWTFAATLTWDGEAGLITRCAPGVDKINRDGLREGWCDHCRTDRYRNLTYLVINNDTGDRHQVGSTCIKDFLGWSAMPVTLDVDSVTTEVEDMLGGGGFGERRWTTDTVLAVAWAAVQAFGFVPASSYDGCPTKSVVATVLDPHTPADRKLCEELRPYVADAAQQAKVIREYILSDDFGGGGEYVINMKAVIGADSVSGRNLGLVASAPQTWARGMERDLIRRQQAEQLTNEYLAPPNAKIEATVKIKSIRYLENAYGTTTVYTLITDTGHVLTWYATRSALGDKTTDDTYKIKATVKKHDEYQGSKRTVITRAKVI
jgi:hypothetical protein